MDAAMADARRLGLLGSKPLGAVDATGLSADGRSSYYAQRLLRSRRSKKPRRAKRLSQKPRKTKRYRLPKWPKISALIHTQSHLIVAASFSEGPSHDAVEFPGLLRQAAGRVALAGLLADSGYDAESHHRMAREELGIRSSVIALNPRNQGRKWPKTKYRRQMKTCFPRRKYGQRNQAESVWSRDKRRFGWVLSAKSQTRQVHECQNRVMLHNIAILALQGVFNRAA